MFVWDSQNYQNLSGESLRKFYDYIFQVFEEEFLEFSLPDNDSYKNNSYCEGILRIFVLLMLGHMISKCLYTFILDLNNLIL